MMKTNTAKRFVAYWMVLVPVLLFSGVISQVSAQQNQDDRVFTNHVQEIRSFHEIHVSLQLEQASLHQIILQLEEQMGLRFMYNKEVIENSGHLLDLDFPRATAADVLLEISSQTGLKFRQINRIITVGISDLRKPGEGMVAEMEDDQTIQVSGTVTDSETGETMPGVNVLVLGSEEVTGSTIGTQTNIDGEYILNVPEELNTLRFSYIGYQSMDVEIDGRTEIDVALESQAIMGDELVVVGYGVQRAEEVTGSVGRVRSQSIENQPVSDLTEALQGMTGNLTIQRDSGEPGAGVNINVRGISTMNNNNPLIVIDGVVGGNLSDVAPQDIEDISVLKDAGSAAIYGSRAASGVILVTTRGGQRNTEPRVTFSNRTGINSPDIRYEPVPGYQNAILRNQMLVNSGNTPVFTPEQIRTMRNEGDIEWFMDTIFQDAVQQDYNLAVAGGSDNTTYRVSARYIDHENNFVGDYGMKRYNFRVNLDTEYSGFDVQTRMSFQRSDITNHTSSTGFLIADAKRTPPYYNYQMKSENGRYLLNDVLSQFNPLGQLEAGGTNESTNDVFSGGLQIAYDITDNLRARGNFAAVLNSNEGLTQVKPVRYYANPNDENYASSSGTDRNTNTHNYSAIRVTPSLILDYVQTFSDVHNVNGLLGVSSESFRGQSSGLHLIYTDPDLNIPVSETEIQNSSYTSLQTRNEERLHSVFGRMNYSYDQRYLFEFNFRYDGSSKFASGNRWGFFPSFSVAWNISDEDFMQSYYNNVGDLKLRASYGSLGNQSIPNYQYQTSYFTYSNAYAFNNNTVGGTGFEFANEDLKWETTTTLNVGVDASFFDNRVRLNLDAYEQTTTDILVTPTVPGTYGGSVPDYNAGEMRNRGWEASLNFNAGTADFYHNIQVSLSDTWNEVTRLIGDEQISGADQMQMIIREGVPFNSYYGYEIDGFFQNLDEIDEGPMPIGTSVQPGDVRYVDQNGDGIIDENDRVILGNAFPRYTFGLEYTLNWKNFDLGVFFQGVGRRTMFLRGENVEPFHANYSYTMFTHQTDFWTPTNPDARWPRLTSPGSASNSNNYQMSSDLYAFDASYIRLKNLKVGYRLPTGYTLGLNDVYVYLNAKNLFTLSDMDFLNPEVTEFNNNMSNAGANSGRNYPDMKYFGFGIDITF